MDLTNYHTYNFSRGRVALYALLKSLNIGNGDKVAIQAYTCVAVPESIIATGAIPLYIDIDPEEYSMSPESLVKNLTTDTKAIVVQHTFGIPTNMEAIMKISKEKKIPVIEDCCHVITNGTDGIKMGKYGVGSFNSWEWGKPIIAGLGGTLIINDNKVETSVKKNYASFRKKNLFQSLKISLQYIGFNLTYSPNTFWQVRSIFKFLSKFGFLKGNYNAIMEGGDKDFRYKMDIISIKRLKKKLSLIDKVNTHSKFVSDFYEASLNKKNIITFSKRPGEVFFYSRFPLKLKNISKQKILESAKKANIELADWYSTPVHPLRNYNDFKAIHYELGSCPNAEKAAAEVVTLPTNIKTNKKFINRTINFFNSL